MMKTQLRVLKTKRRKFGSLRILDYHFTTHSTFAIDWFMAIIVVSASDGGTTVS
jgi:hypothetical protein